MAAVRVRCAPERNAPLHDSIGFLAVVAAVFFLGGFVKGVIGFGLPAVSVGLLGLLLTPAQAAAIVVGPAFITNVWQGAAGGAFLVLLRRLWPLLAGICIGTSLGVMLLPSGNSDQATIWLGVVLAVYAGLGLSNIHFMVPPRAERWLSPIAGMATGAVTVATGMFTFPGVPYVHSLGLDRDRLVQALGVSFVTSSATLTAALGYSGNLHAGLAVPSLVALAAALVGMPLGRIVRGKVRPESFRLWFLVGLLLLGLSLALHKLL